MADYQGAGYHGNLDFWGNSASTGGSPWWNQDMSDAGQALYQDPSTALQAGTIPKELLAKQAVVGQEARQARGGFIGALANDLSSLTGKADQIMRNVVGDDVTNIAEGSAKALWWPIDKAAQGAYWAYSEAVSQPLSTLLIKAGQAENGGPGFFDGGWGKAYGMAENTSPAQALTNMANVEEATGKGTLFSQVITGNGRSRATQEQKDAIKRNTDRFLTDSEYWRDKQGWTYTAGTGSMDFALSMGADPAYAGLKFTSAAVKGARSVKLIEEGSKLRPKSYGVNELAGTAGEALGRKFAKTPEEASRSKHMNDFFDWATSKSPAEIRQHPIWGSGRRVNPEADRLSQVFSAAERDDMPLILRYAGGDKQAAVQLVQKNQTAAIAMQKAQENRVLVDSVKFDADMLQHFMTQESKGLGSPAGLGTPGVVGTSAPVDQAGRLMEPPTPFPKNGTAAQKAGWQSTYSDLANKAQVHRQAAGDILNAQNGVRPMAGAAATSQADILRAQTWKADQLDVANRQIDALQQKSGFLSDVLGKPLENIDEYSPGASNLFGSMQQLYRMGPLALKDTEKAANKRISNMATGTQQYGKVATAKQLAQGGKFAGREQTDANFVSRAIRNGFFSPQLRVVHSLTDRMPLTFIDHNAEDATSRVTDMLKRVQTLDPNTRLAMINDYSRAGDKISREESLNKIHGSVIEHMASQYAINPEAARVIDGMIKDGSTSTIGKLTGQTPTAQQFSAAGNELAGAPAGARADMVEDGEHWIVSPLAKTQLQAGSPLLDVKELDRFLKKNSTFLNRQMASGATALDSVKSVGDALNGMWKASTLLRPGYILRSMSEEQAASAIKFGVMSSVMDSGHGGWNWARNRANQIGAEVGLTSYGSTLNPSKATVRITDPAVLAAQKTRQADIKARMEASTSKVERKQLALELKATGTSRIKVNDAWPVVQGRLGQERDGIKFAEDTIAAEKKRKVSDPDIISQMNQKIADHKNVIDEFTAYGDEILRHATDSRGRRLGEGTFEHRGQKVPQAFSGDWMHPLDRNQITSHMANASIFARSEAVEANRLIGSGSWTTITPDMPTHMTSWLDALNKQFKQDDLFRLVAEDPTLVKARQWLGTADGKAHRSVLGLQGRDAENLLTNVKTTLDTYLPRGTGLQDKIAKNQDVAEHELRGAMDEGSFPAVHGEEFLSLTRKGSLQSGLSAIDKLIEKGFNRLGTVPNDIMARQPIYLRAQEARMRQFMDDEISFQKGLGNDGSLSPQHMNNILNKSDKYARKDISSIVYDPTRTTASEALRFIAPFMAAHMDGLERWGGLVAEKPQFVATAAKIYNAPVAAHLVTDMNGREVDQKGYADVYDPVTGKKTGRVFVPLEDRVMNLRIPDGTKNVRDKRSIPIKLSALNTILPGDPWWNPGSGPFAQIAASSVAKQVPQFGDFLQWTKVIPYGPNESWTDSFTPKYMKDAWNAFTAGEAGNDAYQAAYLAEYQRQQASYVNGGPPPDMKTVAKNAKQFMYLDALTSWTMPAQNAATPLTGSPYQFFLDQYKTMQETDPKNAKTNFFQKYGEDYFIFTASLSKSMGIQATQTAENTANKYGDLIAQDPSMASLIVGDVYNQGKFSTSVYRKQMDELLGGTRVREKISAEEAIRENQKDKGWQQYGNAMGSLDAELIRSGFKSYNQMGAQAFLDVKRHITEQIADGNDPWFEDFGTTSTSNVPLHIQTMQKMVDDPELMADSSMAGGMRDDLTGISMYLQGRKQLQAQLKARGARSLSFDLDQNPTGQNADIGYQLKTLQLYLVNNSLGFGDVFHRYLENDNLSYLGA